MVEKSASNGWSTRPNWKHILWEYFADAVLNTCSGLEFKTSGNLIVIIIMEMVVSDVLVLGEKRARMAQAPFFGLTSDDSPSRIHLQVTMTARRNVHKSHCQLGPCR